MAGNSAPIFSRAGLLGFARVTAVNNKSDGSGTIGTDMFKAFTADPTNGSFIQRVRFTIAATGAGTSGTSNNTVLRAYVSTVGSGTTTASDTKLWGEIGVPQFLFDGDVGNNPIPAFEIPFNIALEAGQFVHVSCGASAIVSGMEFHAIAIGGKY